MESVVKKNVVFMVLSVFSVQGAAYVAQLLMARMLQTDQFAIVRTVEAALQVLSAVAPMGISLLVVRLAAQIGDPGELRRRLTSYMVFAGVAGLLAASLCALVLSLFATRQADHYLYLLVWVVVLSNLSRTALNYFYGKEQFALLSITTFVISICYLAILTLFVSRWHLEGWVAAKYLGELFFVVVTFFFIRPYLSANLLDTKSFCGLLTEGVAVSLSLVFRSAMDNFPLLVLAYLATSQIDVAMYGLCTLLAAAGMIIPASINSVLLPKYSVLIKAAPADLVWKHKRFVSIVVGAAGFVATSLACAGVALPWALGDNYTGIAPLLAITVLAIPLKALTTLNGNLLFVNSQTRIGTQTNACGALASIILSILLFEHFGVWGVAVAALLVEAGVAVAFSRFAASKLAHTIVQSQHVE